MCIASVVSVAYIVEQYETNYIILLMFYSCLNSFLYYEGVQYGGWAGPDNVIQESFAGTPENGQGCQCGNDGTCSCKSFA